MKKEILLKLCKSLLIINIIFWSIIAVYFSFFKLYSNEDYLILKVLLFFEPLSFTIILVGLIKRIKIIYWLSIVFLIFNAIISITDEVGVYDIIAFILNILVLVNLLIIRKHFFNNTHPK